MEDTELKELTEKNVELEKQLTKRNEQYVFDLKKTLANEKIPAEHLQKALNEMLTELVEKQKTGITAKQLYGSVKDKATAIIDAPRPQEIGKPWEAWLDNTLLMFIILSLISGVFPLLLNQATQQGIITQIVGSVVGGYVFYIFYKYIIQYDRPGADKSKRPGAIKSGLIMMAVFSIWLLFMVATYMIPTSINIMLDPVVNIILAGVAFGIRYFLKKKFGIQGTMFAR